MYSEIQKIYQVIDTLTKRIEVLENKQTSMVDTSTQSEIIKLSIGYNPLTQSSNTTPSNYQLMHATKTEDKNISDQTKNNLSIKDSIVPSQVKVIEYNPNQQSCTVEIKTQNTTINLEDNKEDNSKLISETPTNQSSILLNKEIKILEGNKSLNKTYSSLISTSHLKQVTDENFINSNILDKQNTIDLKTGIESISIKIENKPNAKQELKQDKQGENTTESLNKLNQMKKIGLQDMATSKISKMIKNHSILKESINTPLNITNKVKLSFEYTQSIGKCFFSKTPNDNLQKPLIEQKVMCLNTSFAKQGNSLTSRKPYHTNKEFDSLSTYKIEKERITREKEMAINRREKTREISQRNRQQAAQKKEKGFSKPKSQNTHSLCE